MWITRRKIFHNKPISQTQFNYINDRIETLAGTLSNRGYDVSLHGLSLVINGHKVSFRICDYVNNEEISDHTIWLADFDTWREARNYFYKVILPKIKKAPTIK